jgi:uncharacterized lipoprotein YmbA
MMRTPRLHAALLVPLLLVATSACRLPQASPAPRYWVLTPIEGTPADAPFTRSVGVGPVELPPYLDRSGIVTRPAPGRVEVASFDLWAAPLGRSVVDVVSRNLEVLVPGLAALAFPWKGPTQRLDMRLVAKISRFEASADGAVHLEGGWALRRGEDGGPLSEGIVSIREPVEGEDTAAVVAAMSRALASWSRDVAEAVAGLGVPKS